MTRKWRLLSLGVAWIVGYAGVAGAQAEKLPMPRRVKVLFLGDNGHHVPLERCRQIYTVFGEHGIDLTYTDQLTDLTPENLNRFDDLLLYANIGKGTPAQEKAILDYVTAGHGYVVLHCGSYCFLDSPELTALTGARFKSHGTGVFKETIVKPDHPIEKGLKPIESWDETYVHEMHNDKDRTILGYREYGPNGEKKEPYTWVRTQGKGRVFYTAWGHDERTWGNVDFQNLVERGIRWAAGDWAMAPQPALKPFEYQEAELPLYLPGKSAGRDKMQMQLPVSPEQSMQHMALPGGFVPELVAAEPDIKKPIALNWDERGRLWLAETFDYPNNKQPPGEGHDQIKICEDTNGDGKADKFTVFADKLSIPTSLVCANGGLIVSAPPDMLFFKDTNGDDKADVRKVLFTGFGTGDTHAGPSNLHWGLDGWIYGTVGYSGFNGIVGGEHIAFGEGIYRFKPDGSKLQFIASTTNNTWGLGFSEDQNLFASTANGAPSFYMPIANRYYEQVRGWPVRHLEPIDDTPHFYPITEKVRQVDFHGSYTAGAGQEIYSARVYPQSYWNRIAFVSEPTGHIVGQFILSHKGTEFTAQNNFNLFASSDEWTAPIAASVGPDGQVWMIDWYNYVVQHNPIPNGFKQGKGNAYETPLRDKRHGRVYRLVYKDGTPSKTYNLTKSTPAELVQVLQSDNLFWRIQAQRLLLEKGDRSVIPALIALTQDKSVDAIDLNPAAIHALWTLKDLGALDDNADASAVAAAVAALKHPSASVRKAAVDVLPPDQASVTALLDAKVLKDPDAEVRKSALLALSQMPPTEAAGEAVFAMVSTKNNVEDRWINNAAVIAGARHNTGFLKAAFAAHPAGDTPSSPAHVQKAVNLIPNPSFEKETHNNPANWRVRNYSGQAKQSLASTGRTGSHSAELQSDNGADTSWCTDVPVLPHTDYRLSGWIKTQDVQKVGSADGALFNIDGTPTKTAAVTGTHDWTHVQVEFNSEDSSSASINCLFGGWGMAKGTAWYDDVELTQLGDSGPASATARVLNAIVTDYAQRAPVDSIVSVIKSLKDVDSATASLVLSGLADNWPQGTSPKLSDADVASLHAMIKEVPADLRDRMLVLADRWGRSDLFSQEMAAATAQLKAAIADSKLDPTQRADAAKRLLAVEDKPDTVALVLGQVTPQSPPALQSALIESLGASRDPDVGTKLLGQWSKLTPTAQKAVLGLVLRRDAWTSALLSAIKSGTVNAGDLLPQQWQALTSNPSRRIAYEARALQKASGREPTADRKAIVEKMLPLASKPGDVTKGKEVFEHNCMVCHTIEGKGGQVGPDLTGIGARAKADNLIDMVDPNRSVEGTYRQWTVKTKDDVISGRLSAENSTSIDIIDAAGMHHAIQRKDIISLTGSDRSVMPEGFEQLPPQDVSNLLEFLGTSKVKH